MCDLDAEAAEKVAGQIREAGGRATAVSADVTSPEAPRRIVEAAVTSYGGVHIL